MQFDYNSESIDALSPLTQGGMQGGSRYRVSGMNLELIIPPAPSGPPPLCKGGEEKSTDLHVEILRSYLIVLSTLIKGGCRGD